ncbi:2-oxo acid dehydrogenase subunit E2 [Kocuria sp. JC486]|uniref:Dihydrolipoamide acetyltransferase component of pyruvate dehydrogenase complex n=1 Tax=Kocuria soli TaxID=2485125 RepID=A0A3N3ZVC7_9MICC|nr:MULTISPECIES: 2-oxo acid dehydrogenase subunit E2 [Kocuria]NHU86203.1 2-oxo acid dehydrogenase subunit E2 [Kocuria sp. JC486]ROZ62298.1 diaminohydroxyphosphoribosylaminopyrimidine deaminase [Kocuria soli]
MAPIYGLEIPKWGMTMDEGVVTEWLVGDGAEVTAGQPVVSVESSKLAGEIEAQGAGVMRRQLGQLGETYVVGTLIGVIADADVSDAEIDDFVTGHGAAAGGGSGSGGGAAVGAATDSEGEPLGATETPANTAAPQGDSATSRTPAPAATAAATSPTVPAPAEDTGADRIPEQLRGSDDGEIPATPHALKLAQEHGIALSKITPTGRGGRVSVRDIQEAVSAAGGQVSFGNDRPKVGRLPVTGDDSAVAATPIARRLAAENGINLNGIRPSGRGGRVTREDVLGHLARTTGSAGGTAQPVAQEPARAAAAPSSSESGTGNNTGNKGTQIPLTQMRKVIAGRLQESYQQSPHFRVTTHADIDELLSIRKQINAGRDDARVTVNDLVVGAAAQALLRVPEVNAQYDPAAQVVTQFEHVDLSVAVSTGEGLITPIVRNADQKKITAISAEMTDLATRAKAGTLGPDEFQGGTFTVSNLGMFGVSHFDAIINPPQVAILAVGAGQRQFVPDDDGAPVARTRLPLTLSADHRVVDGATAARFCRELQRILESPSLIFA